MKSSERTARPARSFRVFLLIALFGSLLPIVAASPAHAGGVSVAVTAWQRDLDTGKVSYNLTVAGSGLSSPGGPCYSSDCRWQLEAWYRSGTIEGVMSTLGSGAPGRGAMTLMQDLTSSGAALPEVTHLRASVNSYTKYGGTAGETLESEWIQVAALSTGGGVSLTVNGWERDLSSGKVSYDLTMAAHDMSRRGGPCDRVNCRWKIEAWYRNGTTQALVSNLAGGAPARNAWSFTQNVSSPGGGLREVTHLKASVHSYTYYGGTAGETFTTDWIPVANPSPGGNVSLAVNRWQRDPNNGALSYDLTTWAQDLSRRGGPCDGVDCRMAIEAWYRDGTTATKVSTLSVTAPPRGAWSFTKQVTLQGTSLSSATDLRAQVYSYTYYSGGTPGETDTSAWFRISNHMQGDQDMIPYEAALATALTANPSSFCDVLALGGGPSMDGDSAPDIWQRCVLAVQTYGPQIGKVLAFMAGTVGFAAGIDLLTDEHAKEDDSSSPSPEEEENPPLPLPPGPNNQPNGCEQDFVTVAPSDRQHVIDVHTWKANEGRSEFYNWVNWEWLATVDSLREWAIPSGPNCVRWVTYIRTIGVDREIDQATRVYSVVTRPDGSLVTTHPGYAKIFPSG